MTGVRKDRDLEVFFFWVFFFLELMERLHEMEDSNHQVSLSKTGIVFLCTLYLNGMGGTIVTEQVWS